MEFDPNSFLRSPTAQKGLSVTFIAAAILLLLSNIGIEIKFYHISIISIFPNEYLAIIQLYIIGALISLAITIIKRAFLNPFIESEPSHICYNCENSMETSELKCSNCGSTFAFSKESNKKEGSL